MGWPDQFGISVYKTVTSENRSSTRHVNNTQLCVDCNGKLTVTVATYIICDIIANTSTRVWVFTSVSAHPFTSLLPRVRETNWSARRFLKRYVYLR